MKKSLHKRLLSGIFAAAAALTISAVSLGGGALLSQTAYAASTQRLTLQFGGIDGVGAAGAPLYLYGMGGSGFDGEYRSQLDADSQSIYDALYAAYKTAPNSNEVSLSAISGTVTGLGYTQSGSDKELTTDGAAKEQEFFDDYIVPAILALQYDHPELSWLVNVGYGLTYTSSDKNANGTTLDRTISNVKLSLASLYNDTGDLSDINSALDEAVADITAASDSTDDIDVLIAINEYLGENIAYNTAAASGSSGYSPNELRAYQTAYSAFYPCNGESGIKTVCAGYAKAFKLLCDRFGINCILVSGEGNGEAHAWNYVRLDGAWYAVDTTWNDQGSTVVDDYLLAGENTVCDGTAFGDSHEPSGVWLADGGSSYVFSYPTLSSSAHEDIAKQPLTNAVITLSRDSYTYNGAANEPTVTVKLDGATVPASDLEVTYADNKNVGTATVTVTAKESSTSYRGSAETTFTIEKATPVISWSPEGSYTYTGLPAAAPEATVTLAGGGTFDGEVLYRHGTLTADTAGLPVNAGTHVVQAYIPDGGNYNAAQSTAYNITISKAQPSVSWGDRTQFSYTGSPITPTDHIVTLKNGEEYKGLFTYKYGTDSADNAGLPAAVGKYKVQVSIPESDNYLAATSSVVTINIFSAAPDLGTVSVANTPYIGMEHSKLILKSSNNNIPGKFEIISATKVLEMGDNIVEYRFVPTNTESYSPFTSTVVVKATRYAPLLSLTYEGTPNLAYYVYGDTFDPSGLTFIANRLDSKPAPVTGVMFSTLKVGDTSVTATYTENGVTKSVVVEGIVVERRAIDVSLAQWQNTTFEYTGNQKTITLIPDTIPKEVKVTYRDNKATDAGVYTAVAEFSFASGYTPANYVITGDSISTQWVITKAEEIKGLRTEVALLRTQEYSGVEVDLNELMPDDCGECTYSFVGGGYAHVVRESVSEDGILKFDTVTSTETGTDEIYVKVTSTNYEDSTILVTVKFTEKKPVSITGVAVANGVYNGKAQIGYTGSPAGYNGALDIIYKQGNKVLSDAPVNAGTYTVTFVVPEDDDEFIGSLTLTFTVARAELIITAESFIVPENDPMPRFEYTVKGLVGSEKLLSEPNMTCSAQDTKTPGKYSIVIGGAACSSNYTIGRYVHGTLEVTRKEIVDFSGIMGVNSIYNGKQQEGYTGKVAYSGKLSIVYKQDNRVLRTAPKDAGTYTVTLSIPGSDTNYKGGTTVEFTIYKAPLTITASNRTAPKDGVVPKLVYTVKGLMENDKLLKEPVLTCDVNMKSIGEYDIIIKDADAGKNYTITYINGILKVYKINTGNDDTTGGPGGGGSGSTTPDGPGGSGSTGGGDGTDDEAESGPKPVSGNAVGWQEINIKIEKLPVDSFIEIESMGATLVPSYVMESLRTSDSKITFNVEEGIYWFIDGENVPLNNGVADLEIKSASIPTSARVQARGIVGKEFATDYTNAPTMLTLTFERAYRGRFANLFRYNELNDTLIFVDNVKIAANGKAEKLRVTDKGKYLLMICENSDRPGDATNDGVTNSLDASTILKKVIGLTRTLNERAADFDGDGRLTASDAAMTLKRAIGLI